jgi:putative ABC transport system permease protein
MSIVDYLGSVARDVRFTVRSLARQPSFTFPAVLTLALGIGATTAIFSVIYSVMIKPLPYASPDELVRIRHTAPGVGIANLEASSNMYLTYRDENRTFASVGLWQETDATVTYRGEPERVRALRVTDGTLRALGVEPTRGRLFIEAEYGREAEGPWPIVISQAFWQRRFGGDEGVFERELTVEAPSGNGTLSSNGPARVIGILPQDFKFLDRPAPDVIVAVRLDPARQAHGAYEWQMLARLKQDETLAAARADLERMRPIHRNAWPPFPGNTLEAFDNARISATVSPLKEDLVGGVASMLWVLMGAIGAVLAIASANIANLMLVRAGARRPELAVRAALGAVPGRIARELLVESLVIGVAGAMLGLLLAYVGVQGLVAIGPENLPRLREIGVYPPVIAFTAAVSLAATLVFGSITAIKHALHFDAPNAASARGSSTTRERSVAAFGVTLVVIFTAAALSSYLPARRAARIDPIETLKVE